MAHLIVTFDLNRSGQNYEAVHKVLKSYTGLQIATTTYIISGVTEKDVWQRVRPYIDSNDEIFICPLQKSWAGQLKQPAFNWVQNLLS